MPETPRTWTLLDDSFALRPPDVIAGPPLEAGELVRVIELDPTLDLIARLLEDDMDRDAYEAARALLAAHGRLGGEDG